MEIAPGTFTAQPISTVYTNQKIMYNLDNILENGYIDTCCERGRLRSEGLLTARALRAEYNRLSMLLCEYETAVSERRYWNMLAHEG